MLDDIFSKMNSPSKQKVDPNSPKSGAKASAALFKKDWGEENDINADDADQLASNSQDYNDELAHNDEMLFDDTPLSRDD